MKSSLSINLKSGLHPKNVLHMLQTIFKEPQMEIDICVYTHTCSWSKVQHLFHGWNRGIPHCIPPCWHVGESTPFSEWFMNSYRPRCGSVDAGSLKGGRRPCIKGRSWNMEHQGRLTIFTSIAQCGRHFKDTSSLKTQARTFMCSRIYLPHPLRFMCYSFLFCLAEQENGPGFWKKRTQRCTRYESFYI